VEQKAFKGTPEPVHGVKFMLELGPLGIFFAVNYFSNIFYATASLMVATTVSLIVSKIVLKRVPVLALVTGSFVIVFGFLTIWLHNETFIKVKPTVVNALFAATLSTGLLLRRNFLKIALGEVLMLTEEGWRLLTLRWIGFFLFLAVVNEVVWRNFSTDFWAGFKSFGIMPMTFLFMIAQIGLIMKYQLPEPEAGQETKVASA
jgi:intracellular septation protein